MKKNSGIRVRFAPSPTGFLHIGGARTALFNWLFAKHYGGKFILRIEDTDIERSTEASVGTIIDSLRWLGLLWDEGDDCGGEYGPYRQKDRLEIYQKYAMELLEKNQAYYCYCLEDELNQRRLDALREKRPPGYDGRCRYLSNDEIKRLEAEGRKPTVRFRVPDELETIWVEDKIRGTVGFDPGVISDFVLIRSDESASHLELPLTGVASYNFAVVIDDYLMKITHIIRGEDHLSNTPRQLLVAKALGFEWLPEFVHLPMILGEDGSRLSKRHGATSVEEYKRLGYLPEALINYLALRGWSPTTEGKEFLSIEELIDDFSLDRVAKAAAIFDLKKLNWMDKTYIRKADIVQITTMVLPYLKDAGYEIDQKDMNWLIKVVDLVREYLNTLSEIVYHIQYFFTDDFEKEPTCDEYLQSESVKKIFEYMIGGLEEMSEYTEEQVLMLLKDIGLKTGIKGKGLYMPIRAVLTGRTHGPELPRIIILLGKTRCIERLSITIQVVQKNISPKDRREENAKNAE